MTRGLFFAFLVVSCSLTSCAQSSNSSSAPQQQSAPQQIQTSKSGITLQLSKPAAQSPAPAAQAAQNSGEAATLAEADRLLATGKPADAQARYQAVVNADPESVPAQVGLARSLIFQQKLDAAQTALDAALAIHPNAPDLLMTLGDLQFAQGKLVDAERSFVKVQNARPTDPAAYLGLARVYRAYSLYRRAYDNMKHAHDLAPNDLAVQLLWFHSLPQEDQVPALEDYLNTAKLQPQIAKALTAYLAGLKRNADAPVHPCTLVSNVRETNTKLYPIARGSEQLGAVGLAVKINNQEMHLALDTGSSGVVLGRAAAEKLGLERLAYHSFAGFGESGGQGGFTAVANRIRIGDLEFNDCTVRVTDAATPVTNQDGLIGTDVFSAYLVDIDIPGAKLRLSPLPKRPDTAEAPAALKTLHDNQQLETEGPVSAKPVTVGELVLPKDAYVAPEMAKWTKALHFGNLLLVGTKVDNTGPLLFLIDTGSFANTLSTQTARRLTQLRSDPTTRVSGLSGSVGQVYRVDTATLDFPCDLNSCKYSQANQNVVTFDLSNISHTTGTEVAGVLGFNMLRILQIKIDYRDGLVDFVFDAKHLPKQMKLNKQ